MTGEQPTHRISKLGAMLVRKGVISKEQLAKALDVQGRTPGEKLGRILARMHAVSSEEISRAIAEQLGIRFVDVDGFEVDRKAIELVAVDIARRYDLLPLLVEGDQLLLAMANPLDQEAIDVVRLKAEKRVATVAAATGRIRKAISKYYASQEEETALGDIMRTMENESVSDNSVVLESVAKQAPMISLVEHIVNDAVDMKASDVHIRPLEKNIDVLFRVHGTLISQRRYSIRLLPALVSRIKIVAQMDITERRLPQDGRFQVQRGDARIDFRVSVIPTIRGESVVIRILDARSGLLGLDDIGLDEKDAGQLGDILSRNQGLFLVTGPTGSGKSTTLYAALQTIRDRNLNIVTVENPVEYRLDGVIQIQVKHDIDYGFARALRHILRHDPDVIMVGEIRDSETLKMAIESGLTGHLVLSTLHTNDAATTIGRAIEMGAAPYLISSVLLGVLAQRLVRVVCPDCRHMVTVDESVRQALGAEVGERFYRAEGCAKCNYTGYVGRASVYELLKITPAMEKAILQQKTTHELQALAEAEGMVPLTHNALKLARAGKTSLEEVYRIRLQ